ncbi:potassium channel family protein [Terrabacter sp. NPDC080008]|uniref:potassium channel family protein n=1 Tax=Terrabacter sp. NPDC080008 TaxID=3155176 RepID=UPI00344FE404
MEAADSERPAGPAADAPAADAPAADTSTADTSAADTSAADASAADARRMRRAARESQAPTPPAVAGRRLLDRFDLVLLLVLAVIAIQSLVDTSGSVWGSFVTHSVTGLALIVATRASAVPPRACRAFDLLVLVTVVGNLVLVVASSRGGQAPGNTVQAEGIWLVAELILPVVIGRRVLQHRVVGVQTVLGAVAAYLQIAVTYATLFQTIDALSPQPFFGQAVSTTVYTYFSLVTISTVGYGDFVAVTNVARLAATSEAVIGQVFLVTFVAFIVSRFAASPARRGARNGEDDNP